MSKYMTLRRILKIWYYFDNHPDSLDYTEVGYVVDKKSLDESEGHPLCILDPTSETAKEWFTDGYKKIQIVLPNSKYFEVH